VKTEEDFHKEVRMEHYRSGIQVVREVGIMALRSIITLNSGAFVVLLTFIGNTAAQSKYTVPLSNIKIGMSCFLIGIALSFVSIAYTYVASQEVSPYPKTEKKNDGSFVPVIVVVTGLAFLAFIVGVAIVICGVEVTTFKPTK
jgi:hypothetical protein